MNQENTHELLARYIWCVSRHLPVWNACGCAPSGATGRRGPGARRRGGAVDRAITALACQQVLPLRALQLANIVHFIADDTARHRLSTNASCIRPGSSVELHNTDTDERGWLQLVYPSAK